MSEAATVPAGAVKAGGHRWHAAAGGLAVDFGLYAVGLVFAAVTAFASTLPAHRAWGAVAAVGYAGATVVVAALMVLRWVRQAVPRLIAMRAGLLAVTWAATALLPLLLQAVARAGGHPGRAQEEVTVTELAGARLLDTGTPYLDRADIAARLHDLGLLAYVPYQPGMAVFGLPRAIMGDVWWTDARVWFAVATGAALTAALMTLHRAGVPRDLLIRGAQAVTVLPVCALTLATGGDDIPVLALCVLGFALAYRSHFATTGIALGAAGALKLFAWPVAIVLGVYAATHGKAARYAVGAAGLPLVTLVPVVAVSPGAVVENLVRFPLGWGLVASPAASPLPGRLLTVALPYGRTVAVVLLVAAGATIGGWLLRRPPRHAAGAAALTACGLLAAILLMPATRFGYLLYPAAYGIWAFVLRTPALAGDRCRGARQEGVDRRSEVPVGHGHPAVPEPGVRGGGAG